MTRPEAKKEAWIITVGNEILIGKIANTNFTWLAKRLTKLGFYVRRGMVVGDYLEEIAWGFKEAISSGPDLIIATGGLGPTFDDKTSEGIAIALGRPWVVDERALAMIEGKYLLGLGLSEHRRKMAKMPEGARPIPNPVGTAPGILVDEAGHLIAALPGVPEEMKAIFDSHLEPLLRAMSSGTTYAETEVRIVGIPESTAAPLLEKTMKLTSGVYIKSHPSGRELDKPVLLIHFQATGESESDARTKLEEAKRQLLELFAQIGADERGAH